MESQNCQNFIAFCDELRAYIKEHRHFPNKHTYLLSCVKYTRKKINDGTLEEWKRVMFEEIATSVSITCIDRDGNIVKRVTSNDDSEIEDNEDDNNDPNGGGSGSGTGTGSGTNTNRQHSLNISSADTSKGTVDTSVNKSYSEGSRVNIKATPASGYVFDKWSDGNTSASRTVTMNANTTLVASFIASTGSGTGTQGGGTGDDEDDNPAFL